MGNSSGTGGAQPEPQPELCGGTTGFIMMILMFLILFLMFSPELRIAIALGLDGAFNPIFGFGGKFPALTLLCTSIFLVLCSTTIRHFMTDWVGVARAQKLMTAFQKERTDAMLAGNTVKLKKLEELNPEIQKKQMILMTSNLKPIVFTMIFFIIVFPWVWMVYMEMHMEFQYLSLPGVDKWDLLGTPDICLGAFKNWIFIYILLSFPIGFLIQNGLKYLTFTRQIKRTELEQEQKIENQAKALALKLKAAEENGISMDRPRELLSQVDKKLTDKNYSQASALISDAEKYLERRTQTHERITGLITEAETMINNAKKKGINIEAAQKSLKFARKGLNRNDETSAIYYAKQSQRQVKESRKEHKSAEEAISSVKAVMYDLRELNTEEADQSFKEAMAAMEKKDYSSVLKEIKATKIKAEEIKNLHKEANEALKNIKNLKDTIAHLNLEVPQADELFEEASTALMAHRYEDAIDLAHQCSDLITAEKDKFQEAQDSVSFAKLVVANAVSFGANVVEAEELVADAEIALTSKNYDQTIELATKAKDIAEHAKRQQQRLAKRK